MSRQVPRRRRAVHVTMLVCAALATAVAPLAGAQHARAAVGHAGPSDPGQGEHARQEAQLGGVTPGLTPDPGLSALQPQARGVTPRTAGLAPRSPSHSAAEVFGFAPYWALSNWREWRLNVLTTVSYFGLTYDAAGNPAHDAGFTGWQSQQLTDLVAASHAAGTRVLLTVKLFYDADIWSICSSPQNTQTAVVQAVNLVKLRGLDGITVDFEGATSPAYPSIQQCFTNFMGSVYASFHSALPGSEVVVATYSGAASWSDGFMNVATLAANTDAFFVMAYDMYLNGSFCGGTTASCASSNAPLNGPSYNDTATVQQYLGKAPASKIILGVPYYGYKWSVASPGVNVPGTMIAGHNVDTYSSMTGDLGCAAQLSYHWDPTAAGLYAQWYSAPSGDPCGGNYGSWRELYFEDANSLAQKYQLARNSGIRGVGVWALGYDTGHSELWDLLAHQFSSWTPPTRLAVAGRLDGHVWESNGGGQYWDAGGRVIGAPAVVMINGMATTIATGTDHQLWVRNDAAGWQRLSQNPVNCSDNPGATVINDTLTVACLGGDLATWTASGPVPGGGLPWVGSFSSVGGRTLSGPAVAAVSGVLTYWVNGMDGYVWTRTVDNGWSSTGWRALGHPAAASAGGATYVAMTGSDGHIWYAVTSGTGWNLAFGGGQAAGGPAVAAYGATARIFCQAPDSSIWDGVVGSGGGGAFFQPDGGAAVYGVGAGA